jgi:hypothetical protein
MGAPALALPPQATPLVDQNGLMTQPWYSFFFVLVQALSLQELVAPEDVSLSDNETLIEPQGSYNDGQLLSVILRQNATGGWQPVWGADFVAQPPLRDTTPNTMTVRLFTRSADLWVPIPIDGAAQQ